MYNSMYNNMYNNMFNTNINHIIDNYYNIKVGDYVCFILDVSYINDTLEFLVQYRDKEVEKNELVKVKYFFKEKSRERSEQEIIELICNINPYFRNDFTAYIWLMNDISRNIEKLSLFCQKNITGRTLTLTVRNKPKKGGDVFKELRLKA